MNHISKCIDEASERLEAVQTENKSSEKENKDHRQGAYALNRDLSAVHTNRTRSKQYTRNKNLSVNGPSQEPNESSLEILEVIGKFLGDLYLATSTYVPGSQLKKKEKT